MQVRTFRDARDATDDRKYEGNEYDGSEEVLVMHGRSRQGSRDDECDGKDGAQAGAGDNVNAGAEAR